MLNPKEFAKLLAAAKAANKRTEIVDGDGLYLDVTAAGTAVWRYRYRINGRREKVTIGTYPGTGLADARSLHKIVAGKVQLAISEKSVASPAQEKTQRTLSERNSKLAGTVAELAANYKKHLTDQGKSAKTIDWHIDAYIAPRIGNIRSLELTTDQIRGMCNKIKITDKAPSSAREVLGTIKRMLQHGVDQGLLPSNPASSIKPQIFAPKTARERSLSPDELRTLLPAIDDGRLSSVVAAAIWVILLTMTRKNETIKAAWHEFDLPALTWLIPPERTKNGKPHLVPLSPQVASILAALEPDHEDAIVAASPWVFLGQKGKPLSDTTLNEALTRVDWFGLKRFTIHDLRRTASTILHEQGWNTDVIEKALNHTMRGVRGVYNKAEYIDQRREMLQAWAGYLVALKNGAKIIPIRKNVKPAA